MKIVLTNRPYSWRLRNPAFRSWSSPTASIVVDSSERRTEGRDQGLFDWPGPFKGEDAAPGFFPSERFQRFALGTWTPLMGPGYGAVPSFWSWFWFWFTGGALPEPFGFDGESSIGSPPPP
jgi:hypothetical protein